MMRMSCHCKAGSDTAALFHRTESLAREQQWKENKGLSHRFCTHNSWPFKAIMSDLSDSTRGTPVKQKGNTTAPHNCFQARGFLVDSQVLIPCLTRQSMELCGGQVLLIVCVSRAGLSSCKPKQAVSFCVLRSAIPLACRICSTSGIINFSAYCYFLVDQTFAASEAC